MEALDVLRGMSLAFAVASGSAAAWAAARARRRRKAMPRGVAARVLLRGIGWARPIARSALKRDRVRALVSEAVWEARRRGMDTGEEAVLSVFVACVAGCSLLAGVVSASWAGGAATGACLCALAAARARGLRDRRRDEVREAVPDALRSMAACFQSGFSLQQTFRHLADESCGPLKPLFRRASSRLETGGGVPAAVEELRRGAPVADLSFVAVALDVQHQAGGSMAHVLDSARETVEGELELKRSLHVQTAQAKLSARVVSLTPLVLVAVFSLVSEGFLDPFFSSTLGLSLLALAVGMQVVGIMAVRRMLAVEVG